MAHCRHAEKLVLERKSRNRVKQTDLVHHNIAVKVYENDGSDGVEWVVPCLDY